MITFEPDDDVARGDRHPSIPDLIYLAVAVRDGADHAGTIHGFVRQEAIALVEAAPKLLEAARKAEAVLARGKWLDTSPDPEAVALRELRAAIDKATK